MRMLGLIQMRGGWKFEAKHVPGIMNKEADGISRWNRKNVQANLADIRPDVPWQDLSLSAQGREGSLFRNLGLGLVRHTVAHLSQRTYEEHFGSWVWFGQRLNKHVFLDANSSSNTRSRELVECIAYTCMSKSLQATTVESHLSAIKHVHRLPCGVELETPHPLVIHVLKCVSRCQAEFGTQPRLRRPPSWPMLRAGEALALHWGPGGRFL